MKRVSVALGVVLLTVSVHARDTRKELTVDLKFIPQEGVHVTSVDTPPAMLEQAVTVRVEDGRGADAAKKIGQGTNDDDVTFAIESSGDVVEHVGGAFAAVLDSWGFKSDKGASRQLTLKLTRFYVDESNKAVGSVYAAEVKLAFFLDDAAGKRLAEGSASGTAHRYGRARSAENCNEVLSDAMKEAFANVIADPNLQAAWASGRPAASAASAGSAAAPAESVEERLRKLDDLLKKGLITKEEYAKKRAAILNEL